MNDKKIIINVGRQIGSGGRIVAQQLAKDFGCKFYDKELLNLAAKESGFSEKFFEQNDEQKGFFKSLFHIHMPFASDTTFYNNKFSQESLFQFQSDAIKKAADEGSCVFVGRCADYVLRDYENTVSVFITADMKDRAMRVSRRHLCDMETAERIIENCAHPDYKPLLREYLKMGKFGQTPHTLQAAFAFHVAFNETGDMRNADFSKYMK